MHSGTGSAWGGNRRIVALADVFNLVNQHRVLGYDYFTEIAFQVPDENFGCTVTLQTPRVLRIGARFEF